MSYDQWKTASPYDNEPDCVEIAEKWLQKNKKFADRPDDPNHEIYWVMSALVEYIEENI